MTHAILSWLFETTIKGSVLVVVVAALSWLIGRRVDARWRHLLWVVVLIRLLMPVAPESSFSIFNLVPAENAQPSPRVMLRPAPVAAADGPAGIVTLHVTPYRSFVPWLIAIWIAGALVLATRFAISAIRMRRAIPESRQPRAESRLPIIETPAVRTPALHGLVNPVLLLPRGFTESFSAEELRHVVLHEQWHVKRMDVAVSWLLAAVQCVHWFNPLVWFAASRIREERELACDELALSLLEEDERHRYGGTVLKLLERFRPAAPVPALVGIVNGKQKMKRRLTMIASFRNGTRFTTLFLSLVVALAFAGLTDAEGIRRKFVKKIDPAAHASVEKLHGRVSFELNGASFADLLNTISNKTGLAIIQDPAVATSAVQTARFTVKADNVPAHLVLTEALMRFELAAEPTVTGVSITSAPEGENEPMRRARIEVDVAPEGDRVMRFKEKREIFVGKNDSAAGDDRRELKIRIEENGVVSEGTLTIHIE
jgi:beta-lactamase regulating signal transducer with metallopeptidase domain